MKERINMANNNLKIELQVRKDKNNKTFFIGKLKAPVLIDCSKGCAFLIYTSENGLEEMQIAPMEKKANEE